MRVVHQPAPGREDSLADEDGDGGLVDDDRAPEETGDAGTVLATEVEVADSTTAHARGLRFRESLPEGYAFVMRVASESSLPLLGGPSRNVVDMFFMRVPLDVVWLIDEEVVTVKRMRPWRSFGVAKADTIIELPAGAAEGVRAGDTVRIEGQPDGE